MLFMIRESETVWDYCFETVTSRRQAFAACIVWSHLCSHLILLILIYLLTAIGLSPGGSSTVHINTQTMRRTTQITTNVEESGPCSVFARFTLSFALELRKKHGKTSVRVRKTSVRLRKTSEYRVLGCWRCGLVVADVSGHQMGCIFKDQTALFSWTPRRIKMGPICSPKCR
jgi:hypothetical protein